MDRTDEKILKLLQGNARLSYEELGQAIGMSRVAAKKRVKKLEDAGIIRGYNTCIYKEGEITAFLNVETTTKKFDEVLRYVSTRTEWVRQIFCLHQQNHFMMVVVAPTFEDLRYLAKTILDQDGVQRIACDPVAEVIKDVYGGVRRYDRDWKPQSGDEYSAYRADKITADAAGRNTETGTDCCSD